VQRAHGDPLLFDVVYHGNHTCAQGKHRNSQRPQPAASGEHWQPQPAGGQERISVGLKTEGGAPGAMAPFSFPSKQAAGAHTGSDFPAGRAITASPFKSPATSECKASTTESPMGDMDFMLQLADADFLDNSRYL
jgi:hypothetical protein